MNEDLKYNPALKAELKNDILNAYIRGSSKLRSTVRKINDAKGVAVFQKTGKGMASTKSTHGMVPVMNLDHSQSSVYLKEYFAGEWLQNFGDLSHSFDERLHVAKSFANCLGRKTDEIIIDGLDESDGGHTICADGLGMTKEKAIEAFELFGEMDIPDDGDRFAVVGWKQWADLLSIESFIHAPYVEPSHFAANLPIQAKHWLGTIWIPHSGLPIDGDDERCCFWYHRSSIGHASGDIDLDITWHGDRHAHFVNAMIEQGSGVIDDSGIVKIFCNESVKTEFKIKP